MRQTYSRKCPHCSREVMWPETETYPFCSEQCRLIDLGAWASEDYRIPGEPVLDEEDSASWAAPEGEGEIDWNEDGD
jgi:endogenous inhibitor of DNA gyrase (YacG/DUF329 family)